MDGARMNATLSTIAMAAITNRAGFTFRTKYGAATMGAITAAGVTARQA